MKKRMKNVEMARESVKHQNMIHAPLTSGVFTHYYRMIPGEV
jgi:hypothetical protein